MTVSVTFRHLLGQLSLTVKTLLATVLAGLITWAVLDAWQTHHLKALFNQRLAEVVQEKSVENRVTFDRYLKSHHQAVRLLAAQDHLLRYVAAWSPEEIPESDIHLHRTPPLWLPSPSVLRTLVPLRYVLLLDGHGLVREVYTGGQPDPPPPSLLKPTILLQQLSHEQSFLTLVDGHPYLVTAETVTVPEAGRQATLMLASPLDNAFLSSSHGPTTRFVHPVALVEGEEQRIIATNRPDLVALDVPLTQISNRFVVAGKSYFDYGSSDLLLQLVTLIANEEFESLGRQILLVERQQRAITAFVLILSSLLIILWLTRQIRQVSSQINNFSRDALGALPETLTQGDEMVTLKAQFQRLTQEVLRSRNHLQGELAERERAEAEIRKLSQAVEQSPAAVMITDTKGVILYVNSQFSQLTGYSAPAAIGQDSAILLADEIDPRLQEEMWQTAVRGGTWKGKAPARRQDGTVYWEMVSLSPIRDAGDQITHFLAIKEDITPRLEMERAMQQARTAAEAANQVKSDFLANITHELRTPLNAIIGFTNLMMEKEGMEPVKVQRKFLKNVLESASHLSRLIDDLLDIAKVNSDQFILEENDFNLPELVESTKEAVAAEAQAKGLQLSCRIRKEVPQLVRGDPMRLRQVLYNVLRNAVKFTQRGYVAMAVERDPQAGNQDGILFTIADTGIGIPEDKLAAIFEPFTQVDSSSTRAFGGSGIGLSIAKRVVELMKGRIWVESREQIGSTFTLSIPLPDRSASGEARALPDIPKNLRVLVAGPNPVNRLILKKLLSSLDLTVDDVAECAGALPSLRPKGETPYSLLFLDCPLITPTSKEMERLRRHPELENLPIILFGGEYAGVPQAVTFPAGLYFLPKPIQRSQVMETVRTALCKARHPATPCRQPPAAPDDDPEEDEAEEPEEAAE